MLPNSISCLNKCVTKIMVGLLVGLFMANMLTYAQSSLDKDKAKQLGIDALKLMSEEQAYDKALKLLEKAQKIDPTNGNYKYEIAYLFYLKGDYKKTINLLKKQVKNDRVAPQCYWLLGAAYDNDANSSTAKAAKVYEQGIKRFPSAGELYLELGGIAYRDGNNDAAVNYWEEGIKNAPNFASNYYWTAKLYCNSSEAVWGLIYGEIFMLLEPNSKRTIEMSNLIYTTLIKGVHLNDQGNGWLSYSQRARMFLLLEDSRKNKLPFQVLFELYLSSEGDLSFNKGFTMQNMVDIRNDFVQNWFEANANELYPNALFDWQKKIKDKGFYEAYSYWILQKGNKTIFEKWVGDNKKEYHSFLQWMHDNPFDVDQINVFYRLQYY